jgi:hypothetical protein
MGGKPFAMKWESVIVDGAVGCAACGVSARVEKTVRHMHPKTGRRVSALDFADGCAIAVGLYIIMALIDGLVMGSLGFAAFSGEAGEPGRDTLGVLLMMLTLIVPLALSLTITRKVNKTFSQALEVIEYCCTQCGRQW